MQQGPQAPHFDEFLSSHRYLRGASSLQIKCPHPNSRRNGQEVCRLETKKKSQAEESSP